MKVKCPFKLKNKQQNNNNNSYGLYGVIQIHIQYKGVYITKMY